MSRNPTIRTRLQIDGEKEYTNAVRGINSDLKVLDSEMKLVTTRFAENSSSVKALTERHGVLEKQLKAQAEKVEALKKGLENAKKATGDNAATVNKWQTDLNKAETQLEKTRQELGKTDTALKNSKTNTIGLGDAINDLTQKFGISLPDGMQKSLNGLGKVDEGIVESVAKFAAMAVAIAAVEKKLIDLTTAQATYADDILTQSSVTGIATDTLQEYNYAAELLDVSVETITGSQTKLIKSMAAAKKGTGEQAEAFKKLHINIKDSSGQLKDSQTVFGEAIDALGKISNETERDALSMQIFGKSAQDLNPLIKAGSGRMKELAEEAQKMGYVLSNEALTSLSQVDDAQQRLNNTMTTVKNQVALAFAPALTDALETGMSLFSGMGDAAEDSGIVAIFGALLDAASAFSPILDVIFSTVGDLGPILKPIAVALAFISDCLTIITNTIAILIEGIKTLVGISDGSKISQYWGNITGIVNGDNATTKTLKNLGYNADGTDYWRGGYTWVGEQGPEIVNLPRGSQVVPNDRIGGGDVFNITIDAKNVKDLNDVVKMAQTARQMKRTR